MAKARRSRRPRTTLILLLLASVTIITLDARGGFHRITSGVKSVAADAFSPVRSGVDDIVEPVGSFLAGSVHYGAVRQQNQKLQQEIDQLRQEQASRAGGRPGHEAVEHVVQPPLHRQSADGAGRGDRLRAERLRRHHRHRRRPGRRRAVGHARGRRRRPGGAGRPGQPQHGHGAPDHRRPVVGRGPLRARRRIRRWPCSPVRGRAGRSAPAWCPTTRSSPPATSSPPAGSQGASYPAGIPVAKVVASRTGATASEESVTLEPLADLVHLSYVAVVLWGPSS